MCVFLIAANSRKTHTIQHLCKCAFISVLLSELKFLSPPNC